MIMNTLEREPDPIRRAAMIAKSDKESLIWQQQDKMINAFLSGNMPDIMQELLQIKEQLKPVSKFFAEPVNESPAPKKRLSKKERERLEVEDHLRMLEAESIDRIKKGK